MAHTVSELAKEKGVTVVFECHNPDCEGDAIDVGSVIIVDNSDPMYVCKPCTDRLKKATVQ